MNYANNKKKKVVIAIPTNGNDGREQLSGVLDWVNTHAEWDVQLIISRANIMNDVFEKAAADADGVYLVYDSSNYENRRLSKIFDSLHKKIVITNERLPHFCHPGPDTRTIVLDNISIGRDAARYFCSLGNFAAYGFVHGAIFYPWSVEREKGFRAEIPGKAAFFSFVSGEAKPPMDSGGPAKRAIAKERLDTWLKEIPKPAAVFAANDIIASEVLRGCERMGIDVPNQIAVLGCDNDAFIAANTRPQLSSLQLPFYKLGYSAAETLDRLLKQRKVPQKICRISGTRLFARASSTAIPPATALVERARTFIAERACSGIRSSDVVAHLGISRSLLDLRYRQIRGKSLLEDILETRLDNVKHQLASTGRTILEIGRACGFNNPNNLKRLFKKRFGISMRDYRNMKPATRPDSL